MIQPYRSTADRKAFTLIELLVVVAIIGVLVSVLIPVVGKIRKSAWTTATANVVSQISRAIDLYHQDYRAYPGPLAYNEICNKNANASNWLYNSATNTYSAFTIVSNAPLPAGFDLTSQTAAEMANKFTDSENLVLGLLGGLRVGTSGGEAGKLVYDPSIVGQGPISLNQTGPVKRGAAYFENSASVLSWRNNQTGKSGHFSDDAGDADDTIIPEFVDAFPEPMPILYIRARVGVTPIADTDPSTGNVVAGVTNLNNSVVTYDPADTNARAGMYDLHQIIGYTGSYTGTWPSMTIAGNGMGRTIGTGKGSVRAVKDAAPAPAGLPYHGLSTADPTKVVGKANKYEYPYDAYYYLKNPSLSTATTPVPYQKDAYILVAPGPDRIYGTDDDITNFGSVGGQ